MTKASEKHEHYIAASIDILDGVSAKRPICGTDYSDVLINYNSKEAWLEVKMSHADNLANPRVYYHEKAWKTRYFTPVAGIIVNELNKSETARDFVYSLADHAKISYDNVFIPTLRSEADHPESIPRPLMKQYCKANSSYIIDFQDRDLTELVTLHYTQGKKAPAYYIQAGDDFFCISNTNPLGLSSSIPQIEGTGKFRVRVSNRSKFYEVQAEIKMKNLITSDFSLLPGSKKQNPFM